MLDSNEEVIRIVENFVCLGLGGEIKGPQTGVHRTFLHEFGIEVDDATALQMANHEIGIAGPLQVPCRRARVLALELGGTVEFFDEGVFKK